MVFGEPSFVKAPDRHDEPVIGNSTELPLVDGGRRGPGLAFYLLVVMAAIALFAVSLAAGAFMRAEGGSYADWLAATATLAAFAAAVFAARYAVEAYNIESMRDEERRQAERRVQAGLVAAWFDRVEGHYGAQDELTGSLTQSGVSGAWVHLRNASPVPVSSVKLTAVLVADAPGGRRIEHFLGDHDIGVLPPTADNTPSRPIRAEQVFTFSGNGVTAADLQYDVEFAIRFRDSAGRHWTRGHRGDLIETDATGQALRP